MRASERHFLDHLRPIWNALEPHERATFETAGELRPHTHDLAPGTSEPADATLVASWGDLKRARTKTPVIYMEHGAGQTYTGVDSGSYIGAHDRGGVIATLVPGRLALEQQHRAQPGIPTFAIGCPKLDPWHRLVNEALEAPDPQLAAITWHWDCHIIPETRSAYLHYAPILGRLARHRNILGHAHPRADKRMSRLCLRYNRPYTDRLDDVFREAQILIADNTSAIYEFASLGRPVIVLNAPWYRRDVEHGLRFWSHVPGIQVDEPQRLLDAIDRALHHDTWAGWRAEITDAVYATTAGDATTRAVTAIREVLG